MRPLPFVGRSKRSVGVFAAGALLLTSLVAQSGTAFAAAGGPAGTEADAKPAAGAPQTPAASAPKTAKAEPQAAPKADPEAEHKAAAKALQESDPAGACPAALDPQAPVTCTVAYNATANLTLTLSQDHDLALFQVLAAQQYDLYPTLTAPDGSAVACERVISYSPGALRCATGAAGTYTLSLRNNSYSDNAVSVAYRPLLSTTACTTLAGEDSKLGTAKRFTASLPTGSVGDCYTTDLAAGDVMRSYGPSYTATWTVYDGAGKRICDSYTNDTSRGLDCTLTGTAPYRVTVQQVSGQAVDYTFSAARLSRPEGCELVQPQAYGDAPDLTSTARCRTLRVPAAGRHLYGPLSATGAYLPGRLFGTDGVQEGCQSGDCTLTAGDHTWAVDGNYGDVGAFGISLRSATETRGCTATADDGLASGAVTGTYGAAGQLRCLTLSTASGKGLYLLNQTPADGSPVAVEIDDANGAKQCDNGGYTYTVCKLTGTAPFRAAVTGTPDKAYALVIHRTDNAAGCTAWPQSGFGGDWGAEVTLTATDQQRCLSIPAAGHAPAEMLDYANNLNQVNAAVYVNDGAGNTACSTMGSSTTTCKLAPGAPYTAMLVGTGRPDTYHLVRRDISPSAQCTTRTDTKVGSPSTSFDFTSALDARCVRVGGAATDKLWLSSRTVGSRYDPSTLLMAVNADGTIQCTQWGVGCQVSGSTSYVAVVVASGYKDAPIHANVDVWKVGGADGWAPECASNVLSANGFPQHSGVLTESAPAYCGVIDVNPSQGFTIGGSSSNTGADIPWFTFAGPDEWGASSTRFQCMQSYGQFGAACSNWGSTAGRALLMLSPNKIATPIEYTLQGLPGNPTHAYGLPKSITPATGRAETLVPAVIHGTGLSIGSKIELAPAYQKLVYPQSVNADGTELHVLVDTRGLTPGSYDLVLDGIGYTSGQPSPGYLPKAFEVTAADTPVKSRFVPLTAARFLDTRDGTGAPKARIGAGGTVSLQVAGVKGVPAGGVTAVVMNLTAVDPSENGQVTAYPGGQTAPDLPSLSFAAHRTVPAQVTVPVADGKVDLRNSTGTVDLVADVAGYYTDAADQGSALTPVAPARFLDTRDGTGAPRPASARAAPSASRSRASRASRPTASPPW
ncbi:hypothetical protein [Kitasatospora cheerisanensis]|uniref:Uncharacterized protein n=1 Tax=Kitasatospora cheerisanensis KCTC 2395 TaxID=1348663 RepID=A0A066ZC20_9ACTN|nr:hypothetical protein [Kitasatospora cheerisanensis]KDN87866.1 hypothetical protein KCH_05130 [Kitasatospora cheerisanensis KCTC 2395]